jgi:hypothetical protein
LTRPQTWNITLERLSPLARALLRLAAWFAPDAIPRGIFSADPTIFSEGLGESVEVSDLAIEEALGELARFSLIRLTPETVSVHRLLQAVEQDALTKEECARRLEWTVRLFNVFAALNMRHLAALKRPWLPRTTCLKVCIYAIRRYSGRATCR